MEYTQGLEGKVKRVIRVLIVDDHVLLTESLCMVLERDDLLQVVGVADNGLEAIKKCEQLKPDIVLMDIKMPEIDGIEATRLIKASCPSTRVIVLTSLESGKNIVSSMVKGADAYLLKDTPLEKLIVLIKCIYWGYCILSGVARDLLIAEIMGSKVVPESKQIKDLRVEHIEIIKYISEGKTSAEIGKILGYSDGTIKNKISKLIELVGVENRSQLVMYAIRKNII